LSCSERDQERLNFLYEEWAHPYFVSKEEYGRIMQVGGGGGMWVVLAVCVGGWWVGSMVMGPRFAHARVVPAVGHCVCQSWAAHTAKCP
jgi:hypothetical protein